MWRIWNKLFGWQYVMFRYGSSICIRRVRTLPNGDTYAICHGDYIGVLPKSRHEIMWLTDGEPEQEALK